MKLRLFLSVIVATVLMGCEENVVRNYSGDPQTNFNALWTILDERYCYFTTKNIDWDNIYEEYNDKIKNINGTIEFFNLMEEMVNTLHDGHVNIYAPFDISVCKDWYESYPEDFYQHYIYQDRYLSNDYMSAGGFKYNGLDNGRIIYIRYESFTSYSTQTLKYIDAIYKQSKGVIIDVRHNGGGSLDYSSRFASCFFKTRTTTGYMRHKTGPGHDDFSEYTPIITDPKYAAVDWSEKPVCILTNRHSYSATNDFVVRMKQAPNATIIGGYTGGGGGMPLSQELPNGWMVRFSAVPMYDTDKKDTEFGVHPDIEMHITNPTSGKDDIIEAAISLLQEKMN